MCMIIGQGLTFTRQVYNISTTISQSLSKNEEIAN